MVALGEVDTELLQALERLGSLDAFAYRGYPQRPGHLGDRFDHAAIHWIGGEAADELAVDLEKIHGQALEIVERGHAGAEVIERKAAAALLDFLHEKHRLGEAGDRGSLADLEAQIPADQRIVDLRQHMVEKAAFADGIARQVDRQERRSHALGPGLPPAPRGALQPPPVHRAGRIFPFPRAGYT